MSTFVWPPSGGAGSSTNQITLYANRAAFPGSATNGAFGLALDTDILYVYNTGSSSWVVLADPSASITRYANFAAFPGTAADGTLALALDTDILYAFNTTSNTWVVVGNPAVTNYSFVFQPGGAAAGNVYNDWATLYAALPNSQTAVTIVFDSQFSGITIPAGTYSFQNVLFDSPASTFAFQTVTVTLADGVIFNSFPKIGTAITLDNQSTAAVYTSAPSALATIEVGPFSILFCSIAGSSLISMGNGAQLVMNCAANSTLVGTNSAPVIALADTATATVYLSDNATIAGSTIAGTAAANLSINVNVLSGSFTPSQPDFLGTLQVFSNNTLYGFNGNGVALQADAATTNYTVTYPPAQGANGETWVNNGAGVLSWGTPAPSAAGLSSFVFQPGGPTASGNLFTDWTALYAVISTLNNVAITIVMDSTFSAVTIPAGFYVLNNVEFIALDGVLTTVTCADGVGFNPFPIIGNGITLTSVSTGSLYSIQFGGTTGTITLKDGGGLFNVTGFNPMIDVNNGADLTINMYGASVITGATAHAVCNVGFDASITINLFDNASISQDTVSSTDGTALLTVNTHGTTAKVIGPQTDYAAGLAINSALTLTAQNYNPFRLLVPGSVTAYDLYVPAAQSGVNQTFLNDGAGNLTWSDFVSDVSVVSANGLAGTVATSTTTPAITLTTTVAAPVLSGDGTAINAATTTGTGSTVVLDTSPTLVTPILGTPTSGTLTNCTGLPIVAGTTGTLTIARGGTNSTATPTAGGVGYGTGTAYAFSSAGTSGQLLKSNGASAPTWLSTTGSGNVVLATSPTLVTPVLGTPSSGTLTSCTGLPLTTGVTGVLPIANGGTNNSALAVTAGGVVYTDGTKLVNVGAGTSGQVLKSNGASAPSWATAGGTGTVTSVGLSIPAGLFSVSGSPVTTSGTLALTMAGTSGGVPYFFNATQMSCSTELTINQLVLGGGAGAPPYTLNAGSADQVLVMAGGVPNYGPVNLAASAAVTGALGATNGGTGIATYTTGDLLYSSATNTLAKLAAGSNGDYLAMGATIPGWVTPSASTLSSQSLINLGLLVTASAGTMTIALKQADGSTNPSTGAAAVKVAFRDATAANGDYTLVNVTSALSMTLAGATTLGAASGVANYVYVYLFNNAGTVTLGASLNAYDQGALQSSSTSTTSNAVIYQASALATKPVRLIGRFLATNTASSWASPTQVSLQPFVTPRRIAINANASTTSLTNAYATVVYPTKIGSDPLNAYDASTGTFTCPVAAWYRVSAGISFGPKLWGADHKVGITIAKNGTAIFEGFGSTSGITDVNAVTKAANCSWNIECAVGDTITIQGKQTQTSSGNALDGSIANFICIEKIAGD